MRKWYLLFVGRCSGIARYFKRGESIISPFFSSVVFFRRANWSRLKHRKTLGVRGYAPPGNFWNITCCNGYFSPFWTFFRQTLFKFFDPNSEYSTKWGAFCSHIFNCACLRLKAYCYRRGSKSRKICIDRKHSWKRLMRWIHSFIPFLPPWICP